MMLAGASAIEVGAANLRNPYACKEIIDNVQIYALSSFSIKQI